MRTWVREYSARVRREQPERAATWQARAYYKRKYGVTLAWREAKMKEQGFCCAICGGPPGEKGLMVDHCHKTQKIRELLCGQCNFALHKLENDIEWAEKAIAYLKRNA